ncbi:MAG: glycosyltransferase [Nitrospirae bacterium]|nr:glycosyltransferase [Nitrospirota bacterium]
MRPARVLFTIPSLDGGGAERVLVTLLTHLDRARVTPHLALVDARGVHLEKIPADVPVTALGGRGPLAFWRLLRLIWRMRPDVVFSSLTFYNTLVLLLKPLAPRGVRFIVRENSQPSIHLPTMPYGWLRWRLYPPAHRRADAIVCQSPAMVDEVAAVGVDPERLVCIPNPLDIDAIRAGAPRPDPYADPHPRLVAAGRLVPVKGYDLLLDAFATVAAKRPDATLHLLGEGPEAAALKAQAARLNVAHRVRFHGFVADPLPWFEHADLFVMSSRYEGFPNVTLEAMATGTPVVSFDYPGGSPVVDGVNGWKVPPGDTAALAARILQALDGPRPTPDALAASIERHRVARVVAEFEALLTGP